VTDILPPNPPRRWKVLARIAGHNGGGPHWVTVRKEMNRGTAEAVQVQTVRDGFRVDSGAANSGSTYHPPHQLLLVEVVEDKLEHGDDEEHA
jgi:hypothetical protein